jgi:hypothetical protein
LFGFSTNLFIILLIYLLILFKLAKFIKPI